MKHESKEQRLFKLMKRKWVSPAVAASELNYYCLAQRVSEWRRAGIKVVDQLIPHSSAKRYRIVA
jgi:hypothetical protein